MGNNREFVGHVQEGTSGGWKQRDGLTEVAGRVTHCGNDRKSQRAKAPINRPGKACQQSPLDQEYDCFLKSIFF